MEKTRLYVKTCRHLGMRLHANSESEVFIDIGRKENRDIDVGSIHGLNENEARCILTNKPCSLFIRDSTTHIDYKRMERCPKFVPEVESYFVSGNDAGRNLVQIEYIKPVPNPFES